MTLTRRKSKAAAAAAAAQQETTSSRNTPSPSALTAFTISLPSDIDLDALSGLIPGEPLDSPTEDTILHLYRTLLAHVTQLDATTHEVEELRAEAEKREVELDQGYQDRENDKKEMENLAENLQKELKTVKSERDEYGMYSGGLYFIPPIDTAWVVAAKIALQTQLSSASSSHNASSVELDNLKTRIDDVEREKRDLVSIVSRLKEDCTQRDGTRIRFSTPGFHADIPWQRRYLPFVPTSNSRGMNIRNWRARFENCAQPRTHPRYSSWVLH